MVEKKIQREMVGFEEYPVLEEGVTPQQQPENTI